jgi:glucose/arabinose dehydrogenase
MIKLALTFLAGIVVGVVEPSGHATAAESATVEIVAEGLEYPTNIAVPQDGSGRIFVLSHHGGTARVVKEGAVQPGEFLNVKDRIDEELRGEEGLLSLAFPPGFPDERHVYATYTTPDHMILSRFDLAADGSHAIASSEQRLLQTERWFYAHHCGHLEFGADGLLYLCVGDSDRPWNARGTAQNLDMPQGKLLRLDVRTDNPKPEVVAYGLRNAWHFAFDPATASIVIPDVGEGKWEEVNLLRPGDGVVNFGWALAEGNDCIRECDGQEIRWPVFEYPHEGARCGVIGGAVYRGTRYPAWAGVFVFADYCSGEVWALRDLDGTARIRPLLTGEVVNPTAIGADADGEILIADGSGGAVYRLQFPEDPDAGWLPADRLMLEQAMHARRTAKTTPAHLLDEIHNSDKWRVAGWVQVIFELIKAPFAD